MHLSVESTYIGESYKVVGSSYIDKINFGRNFISYIALIDNDADLGCLYYQIFKRITLFVNYEEAHNHILVLVDRSFRDNIY